MNPPVAAYLKRNSGKRRNPTGTNTCAKCGEMNQEPGVEFCGPDGESCEWTSGPTAGSLFDALEGE